MERTLLIHILSFFVAFIITYFITPLAILLAIKNNCLDIPSERKYHALPTPRWGGITFFIGFLSVLFFTKPTVQFISYLAASLILVIVGAIDDCKRLSWRIKLPATILATSLVVFGGEIMVQQIGTFVEKGTLELA